MTNPLHESQYVTNSSNLNDVVDCKILHFINNEDQEALGYKILITSHRENKSLYLCIRMWRLLKYALYMFKVVRKETLHQYISLGRIPDLEIMKS